MTRKKVIRILSLVIVLALGAIVCARRWNAWFVNPPEPEWTEERVDYHFHTFAEDVVPGFTNSSLGWRDLARPQQLEFILLGDVHNSISSEQYKIMSTRHPNVDFYAQAGDFVERNYDYYFQQLYHQLKGTMFEDLPLIACPGNHEYTKGIRSSLSPSWQRRISNPDNGPDRFAGRTYYVDFPMLRFIVIDTQGLQLLSDFTIVNTWLTRLIQSCEDRFVVVMMHHPVFSSSTGRQNVFVNLFLYHSLSKADFVFSGHDHSYMRRLPFVGTNSATKYYLNKVNPKDDRIACGVQLYEYISVTRESMLMQTRLMDTGEVYDEVRIVRGNGVDDVVVSEPSCSEIITLPERYQLVNSTRVRRFLNRRDARLSSNDSLK